MNRRDIKETLELIAVSTIILYAVSTCNKKIAEYNVRNAQEYKTEVYKK